MAAQRRTAPVQRVPLDGTQSGASASERTPLTLGRLAPKKGSWPKRTRIGRGHGSGLVKTGGKGGKGQTVRSGGGKGPSFEGGQTPWARRLPHRLGYSQKARDIGHFRTTFSVVNLCDLADWDAAVAQGEGQAQEATGRREDPWGDQAGEDASARSGLPGRPFLAERARSAGGGWGEVRGRRGFVVRLVDEFTGGSARPGDTETHRLRFSRVHRLRLHDSRPDPGRRRAAVAAAAGQRLVL